MRRVRPAPFLIVLLAALAPSDPLLRPALALPGPHWAPVTARDRLVAGEALLDPRDPLANLRARTEGRPRTLRAVADSCPHDFDALHYELNFQSVDPSVAYLSGRTVIDLEARTDGLASIGLALTSQMTVSSVTVTPNGSAGFTHANDRLTVNLAVPANTGDTLSVEVTYGGVPWNEGSMGFGGFWFSMFPPNAYSMGVGLFTEPPSMGFAWFPCYDWPCDKATVALNIECPLSRMAVANGALVSVDSTATDHTWHWSHDFPISTYLIAMSVAPYRILSSSVVTDPRISVYFHPGYRKKAEVSFQFVDLMMEAFEARYGPYPFEKFAFMTTMKGDMEHQTCVSHALALVDSTNTYDMILAHEMAHMWFGDCVTYADWHNIWLSEGFATYSEAVYREYKNGTADYHSYVTDAILNRVIASGKTDGIYDPPDNWGVINYEKGASLLHMLRGILDDDALFWQVLRDYRANHEYGNATTAEFVADVEATVGQSLSWFFDPWLYGEGHPHYEYGWSWRDLGGGQYSVEAVVRQVQTTATIFDMPVDFRIQTVAGDFDFSRRIDAAEQVVSFVVPAQPTGFLLDPDDWILDEQSLAPTGAGETAAEAPLSSLALCAPEPNPLRDLARIRYYLPRAGRVRVTIHDVAGRTVRTLWSGEQPAGSRALWWDRRSEAGSRAAAGVYWVRLEAPGGRRSARVVVTD